MSTQHEFRFCLRFVVVAECWLKTWEIKDPNAALASGSIYPLAAPTEHYLVGRDVLLMGRNRYAFCWREHEQVVCLTMLLLV